MLKAWSYLTGIISIIFYGFNAVFFPSLVVVLGLVRFILPFSSWRRAIDLFIHDILIRGWAYFNSLIMKLNIGTQFEVVGSNKLARNHKYFLICNHRSWIDIFVLQRAIGMKVPIFVFFMKKQLLWLLPLAGFASWIVGFPFMQRNSKKYLRKHPEKKGQDLEITKTSCERFKEYPLTLVNFLESTRFTPAKKHAQHSPYKYLLKPRAGTFAFALDNLKENLHGVINTTIVYSANGVSFWDVVCGKIEKITVHYEVIDLKDIPCGNYTNDREFRIEFQSWLNQLWQQKDEMIERFHHKVDQNM